MCPVTEAVAAMFAMEVAERLDYDDIHLEGNSLTVLHAIQTKAEGSTYVHLLLDNIIELSSCFSTFTCSFVRRLGNIVAHMSAGWDTGNAMEKICSSFPTKYPNFGRS